MMDLLVLVLPAMMDLYGPCSSGFQAALVRLGQCSNLGLCYSKGTDGIWLKLQKTIYFNLLFSFSHFTHFSAYKLKPPSEEVLL